MTGAELLDATLLRRAYRDACRNGTLSCTGTPEEPRSLGEHAAWLQRKAAEDPDYWTAETVLLQVAETIAELGSQELIDALDRLSRMQHESASR